MANRGARRGHSGGRRSSTGMNGGSTPAPPQKADKVWGVYILRCGDGSLYTGATNDLERRLAQHRSGKGAAYTRSHLPVTLCHWEPAGTKGDALRREAAIKKLSRRDKLQLIARGQTEAPIHQE